MEIAVPSVFFFPVFTACKFSPNPMYKIYMDLDSVQGGVIKQGRDVRAATDMGSNDPF